MDFPLALGLAQLGIKELVALSIGIERTKEMLYSMARRASPSFSAFGFLFRSALCLESSRSSLPTNIQAPVAGSRMVKSRSVPTLRFAFAISSNSPQNPSRLNGSFRFLMMRPVLSTGRTDRRNERG